MEIINPSSSVKYCIEVKKDFHNPSSSWQEMRCHTNLKDAIYDIESERKDSPNQEFRLIRYEMTIVY